MARRGGKGGNPVNLIIGLAVGVFVFVMLMMFMPFMGGTIENSMPSLGASSDWNATHNTELPSASGTYTTLIALLVLAIIALIIAVAIMYFKGMGKGG